MSKKLDKLSTLIPLHELEQGAQQQIYDALALEFLLKLAVMPDCHTGYTLPIGGVALLDSVISPEYVGYDIGCGMCYVVTNLKAHKFLKKQKKKENLFESIYELIPVGFESHSTSQDYFDFENASGNKDLLKRVNQKLYVQLGTLGGGNHFIEIGENTDGFVTVAIHSGSRNMGHSIAGHYMQLSKNVDKDLPNGFLHLDGEYGQQYLKDMNFALEYALANRHNMMCVVLEIMGYSAKDITQMVHMDMVNENHNHAIVDGSLVLHRKGATPADKDQYGIIPGNMKSGIYVTKGLGNETYLSSASHGAGRKMSRSKAKKSINLDRFKNQMHGIVAKVGKSTLDEAPDAYKDLHGVIERQEGIVIDTVDYAKPLINIKG